MFIIHTIIGEYGQRSVDKDITFNLKYFSFGASEKRKVEDKRR